MLSKAISPVLADIAFNCDVVLPLKPTLPSFLTVNFISSLVSLMVVSPSFLTFKISLSVLPLTTVRDTWVAVSNFNFGELLALDDNTQ